MGRNELGRALIGNTACVRSRPCLLTVFGIALAALVVAPSTASATFHLMSVKEIYPGDTTNGANAEFVELQMYSSGQTQVSGHKLIFYNASGQVSAQPSFGASVTHGDSQRTVLMATASAESAFGVTADTQTTVNDVMSPAGGAVCYDTTGIDCVSWGNFNNTSGTPLPSATGTPAAPAGIPDGKSLTRSTEPGCPASLEASDDTDVSSADFLLTDPTPLPNSVTPPAGCPNTTITSGPSGKTKDRTPTFEFKSTPGGATFECKLDSGSFESCDSPDTLSKQSFGKHKFSVRAVDGPNIDQSPAKQTFKVVKKH
jgi:hypothetical protein